MTTIFPPPSSLRPPFPEAISNTIREAFVQCPQKAFRGYFQRIVPDSASIHLHAGGAFAKGLETTRIEFYQNHLPAEDAIDAGYSRMTEAYGTFDIDNGFENHNKGLTNLQQGFLDYFMEYNLNNDKMRPYMTPDGKAAVEFSFAIPMEILHPTTGMPILYAGKFDMLADYDGTLYVEDDKTTSQLGAQWSQQWDLNSQFTGYCAAARQMGYPVAGAIIRGVGLLKTKITHQQVILSRAQWQIDRWWNQIHRDVKLMLAMWEADTGDGSQFSLALGAACTSYGACPYKRLCESQNPADWISGYYKPSEYNPLEMHKDE